MLNIFKNINDIFHQGFSTLLTANEKYKIYFRAFHEFGQAKFPDGVSALGSSQFSILPQLPPKTMLASKGAKID